MTTVFIDTESFSEVPISAGTDAYTRAAEWRQVTGHEGRYEVSDDGRVRGKKGVLRHQVNNAGYKVMWLYPRTNQAIWLVHRIVATAFLPLPENWRHLQVNHKNCDKMDCRAGNLEWVTRVENVRHAHLNGRKPDNDNPVIGIPVNGGAPVWYKSQSDAEATLSGTKRPSGAIYHCCAGKKKSAYGFYWCRA